MNTHIHTQTHTHTKKNKKKHAYVPAITNPTTKKRLEAGTNGTTLSASRLAILRPIRDVKPNKETFSTYILAQISVIANDIEAMLRGSDVDVISGTLAIDQSTE